MNRIRTIEDIIAKEFSNLKKSINKPKTLDTVVSKEQILDNLFTEYVKLLKSGRKELEERGSWNAQFESFEVTKTKYEGCKRSILKISNVTVL